jgi:hypothetical protein
LTNTCGSAICRVDPRKAVGEPAGVLLFVAVAVTAGVGVCVLVGEPGAKVPVDVGVDEIAGVDVGVTVAVLGAIVSG